ncbi:hypothetical protein [Pseudoflavonifractor sp. MSJ-37]|uniref:hypothetical protein n=1 Tax=Pseudoflavonifractor sp. MSJ-37 TaxID=2841531 RepID=UPI001C0F5DE4|nr:hypothetical protein [Pseudoflavonifractor sp. MSJ-37]MBU5435970.1 hypothetical protein [Pseudoflavonifractor sp. MSJ-37]
MFDVRRSQGLSPAAPSLCVPAASTGPVTAFGQYPKLAPRLGTGTGYRCPIALPASEIMDDDTPGPRICQWGSASESMVQNDEIRAGWPLVFDEVLKNKEFDHNTDRIVLKTIKWRKRLVHALNGGKRNEKRKYKPKLTGTMKKREFLNRITRLFSKPAI